MFDDRFPITDPEIMKKAQEEQFSMVLQYFLLEEMKRKDVISEETFLETVDALIESCKYPLAKFKLEGLVTNFQYDRERKPVSSGNGEHLQTQ